MIQLTKGFAMTADDCCYTVGKPRQKADGRIVLDKPTYYSTADQAVQGALKRAMRQGVADGSITNLREFIREQERLHDELGELVALLYPPRQISEEQRAAMAERMKAAKLRQKTPTAQGNSDAPAAKAGNYISPPQGSEKEA